MQDGIILRNQPLVWVEYGLRSVCGVGMRTNDHIPNQSKESSWVPQSPWKVYHQ